MNKDNIPEINISLETAEIKATTRRINKRWKIVRCPKTAGHALTDSKILYWKYRLLNFFRIPFAKPIFECGIGVDNEIEEYLKKNEIT